MKRWMWFWVVGLGAVACSRKLPQAPADDYRWVGSIQASYDGGQTLESPSGAWVGVEGLTFRDGGVLNVEVTRSLPSFLAVYQPYQASDVVTLRFLGTDLAQDPRGVEGLQGIEGLMYGVALEIPLRRGISRKWGNVVVVANGVPLPMPYATPMQAGDVARVRIPVAVLEALSQPGTNEMVVFFAEGREFTPSPEEILSALPEDARKVAQVNLVGDKAGYPFRLEVQGNEVKLGNSMPYSSGIVVGKKYGVFDPVAVFFSSGYNPFSFWSPVPCSPVPSNPLLPNCNERDPVLTAIYQKLSESIGADKAKKLVGYYRMHHSGHVGFDPPAGKLWSLLDQSYIDANAFGDGKRKIVLTGFSMGGLVSRSVAADHSDAVLGVGTLNTPHLGSIIADLVSYNDRGKDLVDYIYDYVTERLNMGLVEKARFWLELRDPRRTYIPIAGVSEVFRAGTTGIAGIPILSGVDAVTPLKYVHPPRDPYVRVCVSSRRVTVDVPDPREGDEPIGGLFAREQRIASKRIRLYAYMTPQLPNKPALTDFMGFFLWILGQYMGALDFTGPCRSLYPSSNTFYHNDGVVAVKSGRFEHWGPSNYALSTMSTSQNKFHLQVATDDNFQDIKNWASTIAQWVKDYLENQWMKNYVRQYELGWEYLLTLGGLDLELYGMFRDNSLTLDYLRADDSLARRWQDFFIYGGMVGFENHGMVGTGLSRNAGPEGFALKRNSTTTPRVYLVAAIKNPPYVSLDLKVKFHMFYKPNQTSLQGVKDTLIESTKRMTALSKDLYWIIGWLDSQGRFHTDGVGRNKWVGVKELDDTTHNGNVTCYWKIKVLDFQDSSSEAYPIKDNYPILVPGTGVPIRQTRCETTTVHVVPAEVALR